MSTHGSSDGEVIQEEAGVVDYPHVLLFVCELNDGLGTVFCLEREIRPVKGGASQ
jgi:hypothetical protein